MSGHLSASGAPFPLVISRARPCLRFAPVVAPRRGPPISTSASSEPSQVDDGELPAALPHLVHVHGWGSQSTGARHDSTRPRHRHREPCATPGAGANDAREHPLLRRHKCLKPDGGKKPRPSHGPGSNNGGQDTCTTWRATPSSSRFMFMSQDGRYCLSCGHFRRETLLFASQRTGPGKVKSRLVKFVMTVSRQPSSPSETFLSQTRMSLSARVSDCLPNHDASIPIHPKRHVSGPRK